MVGKVLSVERHPDADRLTRLRGGDGRGDAHDRLRRPQRRRRADRPGGASGRGAARGHRSSARAKLRGVTSDGMILSEAELQIGDDADGISSCWPSWPTGARSQRRRWLRGAPLAEVLPLAEPVLELEVSSNRVDCLGVYGVAREVHAFTRRAAGRAAVGGRRRGRRRGRGVRLRVGRPWRFRSSVRASRPGCSPR